MTIQEAIEKSIEGGWKKLRIRPDEKIAEMKIGYGQIIWRTRKKYARKKEHSLKMFSSFPLSESLLDPDFWRCLGKAMGWKPGEPYNGSNYESSHDGEWLEKWHSLIDALASGESAEGWFAKIV